MKITVRKRLVSMLLVLCLILSLAPAVLAADELESPAQAQLTTVRYYTVTLNYRLPDAASALAIHSVGVDLSTGTWRMQHYTEYDAAASVQQNALCILNELVSGSYPTAMIEALAARQTPTGAFGVTTSDQIWAMLALGAARYNYNSALALETLLAKQQSDGSFAVSGSFGDAITTAYAFIVLSMQSDTKSAAAAQHALSFLMTSSISGFGSSDAAAAALSAYVASGRGLSDSFVATAYKELLSYRLADGTFCYMQGGNTSQTSTAAALLAISELNAGSSVFARIPIATEQLRVDVDIVPANITDPFPTVQRGMSLKAFDLSGYGSLAYNSDAPNALHAIISAAEKGGYAVTNASKFDFSNGEIGKMNLSAGIPAGQSWHYVVNDMPVRDSFGRLAKPGAYTLANDDHVTAFIPNNADTNLYTYFDQHTASVKTGELVYLTLKGYRISTAFAQSGSAPTPAPVSNAEILVGGLPYTDSATGKTITTDTAGQAAVTFYKAGTYVVSAQSKDSFGKTNVYPICTVTVTGDEIAEQTRTVTLRIEGKTNTYYPEGTLSFTSKGAPSVYDAMISALTGKGVTYYVPLGSYSFDRIGADAAADGAAWQYTVNGVPVTGSLADAALENGDEIVAAYGAAGLRFPSYTLPLDYLGGTAYPITFTSCTAGSSAAAPLAGATVSVNNRPYVTDSTGKIEVAAADLKAGENTLVLDATANEAGVPTVVRLKTAFAVDVQRNVALDTVSPSVNLLAEPLYITVADAFGLAEARTVPTVSGSSASVTLPKTTIVRDGVQANFEGGTVVTASREWDGTLRLLQDISPTVEGKIIGRAVLLGDSAQTLTLSKPVRILLPGCAGKSVGYLSGTGITPITAKLASDSAAALGSLQDGYLENGRDVILWTRRLGALVAYTDKEQTPASNTVTLRIKGGDISQPTVTVQIAEGENVYSLLDHTNFTVQTSGQIGKRQVTAIGGLKNGDKGENSYWVYKVNGAHYVVPAEQYVLKSGDRVEWLYTEDGGYDIGAEPGTALNPDGSLPSEFDPETAGEELEAALDYLAQNHGGNLAALTVLRRADRVTDAYIQSEITDILRAANGSFHNATDLAGVLFLAGMAGMDIRNAAGYDLLAMLYNHERLTSQGAGAEGLVLAVYSGLDVTPPPSAANSVAKLCADMAGQQNADGGFPAVRGGASDVDATALALTGLAAYRDRDDTASMIERAREYLRKAQSDDGSYTTENGRQAGSVARVITALAALGTAPDNADFVKERGGLCGALATFAVDGAYAAVSGEKADVSATASAATALFAALLAEDGTGALYYDAGRTPAVYSDTAIAAYALPAIDYMSLNGIMTGIGDDRFDPNGRLTREQMVKIIVSALGVLNKNSDNPFTDCQRSAWYAPYVSSAYELGLVTGIEPETFGVGREITRQDLATIIYRAAQKLGIPLSSGSAAGISDIDEIADYAKEAVMALYASKILSGRDDGRFDPKATCTRAEAAVIFYRIFHIDA